MLIERFNNFQPQDFIFKIATSREDLLGFHALRRRIFCEEQGVFREDDRDEIDEHMIPIVCKPLIAGMEDEVIGVVRIDEREPGLWYGSRLGVAPEYRRVYRMSPAVSVRNQQPCHAGLGAIGASLIYKAVSTANAIGCDEFLATVQHQNARFFERLHWKPLEEIKLHGMKHVKMRADLTHYRAAAKVA
ncbi:MAG: histone acetyltransferase [Akkermansiaceae bacterium]|nr:histone acetyltransferase [Akkermansiaceae bacterium]